MRALIAGAGGQLGRALQACAPPGVTVIAPPEADFDITSTATVAAVIAAHVPDIVINAAAYTAVDKAESDVDAAHRINAGAVANLAAHAPKLVHISTDFIFDGSASMPYAPDAAPNPLGVYGATKLAGERAAGPAALIIRTAWVYAAQGNNFVHTMLRLMRERPEIRVVADQIGTPTHAAGLARAVWALSGHSGVFHWTDAGAASWYDFAVAIQEEALAIRLLHSAIPVIPIRTADYPTPARRPAYSVLDKTSSWAVTGPAAHWRSELRLCLQAMKDAT
ncbi:MAG: dTDP-4-dehydrorhamnose reductase [Polymorphobacter sp.]